MPRTAWGLIVTSDDGLNWTEHQMPQMGQLQGVAYGDGLYVAVGYDNDSDFNIIPTIATSENGVDWNVQDFTPDTDYLFENVGYGDGNFIIVGGLDNNVLLSNDGFSWQTITTGNMYGTWQGVSYGNGLYTIAGPNILTSFDGQTWTEVKSNTDALGVVSNNGSIIAVGYGDGHRVMCFICE